jgi:carbon-monoxide dehydrogenase medium subunit
VRNHGTIGGSVALADPAADWPACLLALGAVVRITGPGSERTEPMDAFLQGAYTTSLQPGEIITAFDVPSFNKGSRFGHAKVVRKSGAFAMSIGCIVVRSATDITAVLGGTTSRASLLPTLAATLASTASPSDNDIRSAFAADLANVEPDADAYQQRLHTATILRAIMEAFA